MFFRMKTITLFLIGSIVMVLTGTALATLTTDELTKLKSSGLREDTIRFMIESGYGNVDRVIRLKDAGFTDETISSVIKSDLEAGNKLQTATVQPEKAQQTEPVATMELQTAAAQPEKVPQTEPAATIKTSAKVTIERYLVHGDPILQNSQDINNATISLVQGRRLKVEWDSNKGSSALGDFFHIKPFASPFYWDVDKGDVLYSASQKDNAFILRTGHLHQGMPTTDKAHYWIVHLTPNNPDLVKRIKELLLQ